MSPIREPQTRLHFGLGYVGDIVKVFIGGGGREGGGILGLQRDR